MYFVLLLHLDFGKKTLRMVVKKKYDVELYRTIIIRANASRTIFYLYNNVSEAVKVVHHFLWSIKIDTYVYRGDFALVALAMRITLMYVWPRFVPRTIAVFGSEPYVNLRTKYCIILWYYFEIECLRFSPEITRFL